MAGQVGIPATNVAAVAVTLTVVSPSSAGFIQVDKNETTPNTTVTALDYPAGPSQSNTATVAVGGDGKIQLMATSAVDMTVDVQGYYTAGGSASAGGYVPVTATRLVDTRNGTGLPAATLAAGSTTTIQVTGHAGVPTSAIAVVANLTAVNQASSGYFTPYAADTSRPATSLNYNATYADATGAQLALSTTGTPTGAFKIYSSTSTDLLVDIVGYFTASVGGGGYVPSPTRVLDTRTTASVAANGSLSVPVAGQGDIPWTLLSAVSMDVEVVKPSTAGGYLNFWATGATEPAVSLVNYTTPGVVSNLVTAPIGTNGEIDLHNHGGTAVDIVIDVEGWYQITYSQSASASLPDMTIGSDGWITKTTPTKASEMNLSGSVTSTVTGTVDSDGSCNFPGGSSASYDGASAGNVLGEETAVNFQTCQERIVQTPLTSAAEATLEQDEANEDTTANGDVQSGADVNSNDPGYTPSSTNTTDGTVSPMYTETYRYHLRTWYVDPLKITISSLKEYMTWNNSAYPQSTAYHHAYAFKRYLNQFPYVFYDVTYPEGAQWHDYRKTSTTVRHNVYERFHNNTFADYVYVVLGIRGLLSCGLKFTNKAVFHHDLSITGEIHGNVYWSFNDGKHGACVNLTFHNWTGSWY